MCIRDRMTREGGERCRERERERLNEHQTETHPFTWFIICLLYTSDAADEN